MKLHAFIVAVLFSLLAFHCPAQGTGFTYQGRLLSGSAPFTGTAEILPTLWNDPTAGSQVAANSPASVLVSVENGLFVLPLDFGSSALNAGADRWVQIQVRTTIGPYSTLTPRQKLTPAPYAIFAGNAAMATTAASANSVSAANITGQLGLAQLPPTVVTNTQSGLNLTGTFSGNGGGLTNISPASLSFFGTNGSVVSWGWNEYGQGAIPAGLDDVVALSAGAAHSLALRTDGTVVGWGAGRTNSPSTGSEYGQLLIPPNLNAKAISAGYLHSLALRTDGTVAAWGWNDAGQTNVPPGLTGVKAIQAGYTHNIALKSNGTVVVWGTNDVGQLNVPGGLIDVKAISGGFYHSLALRSNGTVVAWGSNQFNGLNIPASLSNVVAISAGATVNMALKGDGSLTVWGTNSSGELDVPPGLNNIIGISAGLQQCAVLKADGTVIAWGFNQYNTTNVPPGLNNIISLAPSFGYHYLALRRKSDAPVAWLDSDNTFNGSIELNGDLRASGQVIAAGGLRLNDQNIWLRGNSDNRNGLGWYGDGKTFGSVPQNGPVLFGESGGTLGTIGTNGLGIALKWDNFERVTIGGNGQYTPTLLFNSFGIAATNAELRFFLNGGRFTFNTSLTGQEMMTIQPNFFGSGGNVGIGTPSPNARLDVRGEIRFGSTGQYSPVGSDESLRIVRGVVNDIGTILAGTGFTVTKSATAGYYTINFTSSFSGPPAVTVSPQSGLTRIALCTSVTTGATGIWTRDGGGVGVNNQFSFIAIGPR